MSENDENKTPSSSRPEKKATSARSPITLVKLTGEETDEELEKLAQEIFNAIQGGSSSPGGGAPVAHPAEDPHPNTAQTSFPADL